MAAKNPRIHAVLEPDLYKVVSRLAKRSRVSLSQKVRDIVADSVELMEDVGLDLFAAARRETFNRTRSLSVDDVRRRLKLR